MAVGRPSCLLLDVEDHQDVPYRKSILCSALGLIVFRVGLCGAPGCFLIGSGTLGLSFTCPSDANVCNRPLACFWSSFLWVCRLFGSYSKFLRVGRMWTGSDPAGCGFPALSVQPEAAGGVTAFLRRSQVPSVHRTVALLCNQLIHAAVLLHLPHTRGKVRRGHTCPLPRDSNTLAAARRVMWGNVLSRKLGIGPHKHAGRVRVREPT